MKNEDRVGGGAIKTECNVSLLPNFRNDSTVIVVILVGFGLNLR